MLPRLLSLVLLLWAGAAPAEGLIGRTVRFTVETWDNPDAPYLMSSEYVARVGPGPEFGLVPEVQGALFVVPALIDFDERSLTVDFANLEPGEFMAAEFNGYVLEFLVDCVLFEGAKLDQPQTTLPIDESNISIEPRQLRLNVSGLAYDETSRIVLRLEVTDCLMG